MDFWQSGQHLLIDVYNCEHHGTVEEITAMMEEACKATGATVLFTHLHPFEGGGVTGVCILAESHMTIHTWPEKNYAAIDIFVCGKCDPYEALDDVLNHFKTQDFSLNYNPRGFYE